jgi:hypothetical protein
MGTTKLQRIGRILTLLEPPPTEPQYRHHLRRARWASGGSRKRASHLSVLSILTALSPARSLFVEDEHMEGGVFSACDVPLSLSLSLLVLQQTEEREERLRKRELGQRWIEKERMEGRGAGY